MTQLLNKRDLLAQLAEALEDSECAVLPLEGEHYVVAHEAFELGSYQQSQIRHNIEREARTLLLSGARALRVLSIGCGSGLLDFPLLSHLTDGVGSFLGIDPNPFAIERCERLSRALPHGSPARFHCSRFEDFETDETFDLIYCSHVLYYTEHHRSFIQSMASLLKDEGVLVIAHAPREEMNDLAQLFWNKQKQSGFFEDDLRKLLGSLWGEQPSESRILAGLPSDLFSPETAQGELLLEFLIQADWAALTPDAKRFVCEYIDRSSSLVADGQRVLPHPAMTFALPKPVAQAG